jgi:hypothetical protein
MGIPELFRKTGIFPSSPVRATFHNNLDQDRSESSITVNPTNSLNLIGASKLFSDPKKYKFTVAAIFSNDGGSSWQKSAPLKLLSGWEGLSDPALAFGPSGTAYIVTEPLNFNYANDPDHDPNIQTDILVTHMVCYRSTDGGATWSDPIIIDENETKAERFDKPWVTAARTGGTVYATWGYSNLQFARSTNGGTSWKGVGNKSINTLLGGGAAPEINTDSNEFVHIVSHSQFTDFISYLRSKDMGQTFDAEKKIAVGLKDIDSGIGGGGFKHFPNASFRVVTLSTACCVPNQPRVAVAWADYREGVSRIYYDLSIDSGEHWTNGSGRALLPSFSSSAKLHDFHPQLIATGAGVIGCAFYRYYESSALIDVMFTASFDGGETFWPPVKLNDEPWNPAINAPWSHGNSSTTFIGDYFGLDADEENFYVLWTNTKDGVQELYFNSVATSKYEEPDILKGIHAEVFGGVSRDGGGFVIVGGKIIKIPPREPITDILHTMAALDALDRIQTVPTAALRRNLLQSIATMAEIAAGKVGSGGNG